MSNTALTDIIIELSSPDFEITKSFYQKLGFSVVWEEPPKVVAQIGASNIFQPLKK